MKVKIYTDGAAVPNPGKGSYAAILFFEGDYKEVVGTYRLTTNNRMEMMAVIAALESLQDKCEVTLYSDSKYVIETYTKGWKKKKNADLWRRLIPLCEKHNVNFVWVRGHDGNAGNEKCDELAQQALKEIGQEDVGYSNTKCCKTCGRPL